MAEFNYIGRDKNGQQQTGTIEANNTAHVAEQLSRRNIIPITIKPKQGKAQKTSDIDIGELLQPKTVRAVDMIMFCRQMYALMRSGVPILKAIRGLSESTKSNVLRDVLTDINAQLERGITLSSAMHSHPKVFSKLVTSIVHVGENTGQLDESFAKLAQYLEREDETKKNIKQAMRYPSFVVISLVIAMFVLNIFVIPVFADMFAQFKTELPLPTRILMASSNFFVDYWPIMLVIIFGSVFVVKQSLATEAGRYKWDKLKLRIPLVGNIFERSYLARFAHSFAIVLRAGVPITQGLNLTSDAISNSYMGGKVKEMRMKVEKGETLLRTATNSLLFTPLVLQMIAVGEETGRIDELLEEVASFYEREVDYDLKTLTDRIEPILIGLMACIVLMLALGIFLPMWDMYSAVQG